MKYIDSGNGDPEEALGHWLQGVLTAEVVQVRWQTGYFTADSLGLFGPLLAHLKGLDAPVLGVIGSNGGRTLRSHVAFLAGTVGIPRANARLGVLRFTGGLYHPKTYHFVRGDGSQAAYVGSANFTSPGLSSQNVEAGIVLDSRDGDSLVELGRIGAAVDAWFQRPGLVEITDLAQLDVLVLHGVLAAMPPPPPPPPPQAAQVAGSGGPATMGGGYAHPSLKPLFGLPPSGLSGPVFVSQSPSIQQGPAPAAVPGLPAYLLVVPGASSPTSGAGALSGYGLPGGVPGLIVRLNKDSARHFSGGKGTSNISIPVATATSFLFGVFQGKYQRPRAEFELNMRYIAAVNSWRLDDRTNIMPYGFAAGETGHGDLRMVVPAAVRKLRDAVVAAGLPLPTDGDYALLEWPTPFMPSFGLSFLAKGSAFFNAAEQVFLGAAQTSQLVGDGACWLPPQLSPPW